MKVWMWPKISEQNLYSNLLTGSLSDLGLEIHDLKYDKVLRVGKVSASDIVHVHWIHSAYQGKNLIIFLLKSILLILTLIYLKMKRVQIVWTIHNLYPHNVKYKKMEKFIRTLFCKFCSKLIVASESIKNKAIREFNIPESKIFIVKHGHYVGVYESQNIDFRKQYKLKDSDKVLLFVGAVKFYKGIEDLLEAFKSIEQENVYLIIAGSPDEYMKNYLKDVKQSGNIIYDLRFIPNDELADLVNIADAMVLPYKEITTSGSAILALSFQKLIVMPDNDFIDDYFDENMVVRYKPAEPGGLGNALKRALLMKDSKAKPNYEKKLKELDWSRVAQKTKHVYFS